MSDQAHALATGMERVHDTAQAQCMASSYFRFTPWRPRELSFADRLMSMVQAKHPPQGFAARCDWVIGSRPASWHLLNKTTAWGLTELRPRVIFVQGDQFVHFHRTVLPCINAEHRFALIVGDHDKTAPVQTDVRYGFEGGRKAAFDSWLKDARIVRLFVENLNGIHHPCRHKTSARHCVADGCGHNASAAERRYAQLVRSRVSPVPIGINPMEFSHLDWPLENAPATADLASRPLRMLSADRIRGGEQFRERTRVRSLCASEWHTHCDVAGFASGQHVASNLSPAADVISPIEPEHYFAKIQSYSFLLCVHGGGVDPQPKLYTALLAGVIPILRRFPGDSMYDGLPVVLIDCWDVMSTPELESQLAQWRQERLHFFQNRTLRAKMIEQMTSEHWWSMVAASLPPVDGALSEASQTARRGGAAPALVPRITSPDSSAQHFQLHFLPDSDAVCLDGSPAALYYRPSTSASESTSWIFILEGGGWCVDAEDCERYAASSEHGSSRTYASTRTYETLGGLVGETRRTALFHPFAHFNQVVLKYCDGASFLGSQKSGGESNRTTISAGSFVVRSALEFLGRKFQLSAARRVLWTGYSAGGLAAILTAERVRQQLTSAASALEMFAVASFSGLFFSEGAGKKYRGVDDDSSSSLFEEHMRGAFGSSHADLPGSCIKMHPREPWRCLLGIEPLRALPSSIPIFIEQSTIDRVSLTCNLAAGSANTFAFNCSSWPACTDNACTVARRRRVFQWQSTAASELRSLVSNEGQAGGRYGAFVHNCITHSPRDPKDWYRWRVDNVSLIAALKRWWTLQISQASPPPAAVHLQVDDCLASDGNPVTCSNAHGCQMWKVGTDSGVRKVLGHH